MPVRFSVQETVVTRANYGERRGLCERQGQAYCEVWLNSLGGGGGRKAAHTVRNEAGGATTRGLRVRPMGSSY